MTRCPVRTRPLEYFGAMVASDCRPAAEVFSAEKPRHLDTWAGSVIITHVRIHV
jgi:hypothetical protein